MTQHDDPSVVRAHLIRREDTPQMRGDPEGGEEAAGRESSAEWRAATLVRDAERPTPPYTQLAQRRRPSTEVSRVAG